MVDTKMRNKANNDNGREEKRSVLSKFDFALPKSDELYFNTIEEFSEFDFALPESDELYFNTIEEFKQYLKKRQQPDRPYGFYDSTSNSALCRFFGSKNSERVLADIKKINIEQGIGNIHIPNTNIELINYSICSVCEHIFSYKDLIEYYSNPRQDTTFMNRSKQFREDTRVFCNECNTYFYPALVIVEESPKNEVQFLCKVQTVAAIERFYQEKGKKVLSAKKSNVIEKCNPSGKILRAILNDVLLKEMIAKPTLIYNLLQYTPTNLVINLIEGSNIQNGDLLYGAWM